MIQVWAIYDHPEDYPHCFVMRQWIVEERGVTPGGVLTSEDIENLRAQCEFWGLHRVDRNETDHPKIVETWI